MPMASHLTNFHVINRFLEDTSVLITLAYLLTRGAVLPRIFEAKRQWRDQLALALIFGLIGGSELVFPGDRYPYVTYTLAVAFAGYAGGWALGLLTCFVMMLLATVALVSGVSHPALPMYLVSIVSASLIGSALFWGRQRWENWQSSPLRPPPPLFLKPRLLFLFAAFFAGALGEVVHSFLLQMLAKSEGTAHTIPVIYSTSANGFGCLLLGLVLWDAHQRQIANQRHVQAEQEIAHLRLSQLGELQARLQPHFLFNALAGIAGLCLINPAEAEQGITNLAALLRQVLRAPNDVVTTLREERAMIQSYLSVERLRMGHRLQVDEQIEEDVLALRVPRFCLQVLVENAVRHGLAATEAGGQLSIVSRRYPHYLVLAVCDTGAGLPPPLRFAPMIKPEGKAPHGLELLAVRLTLAYGPTARLRLFSRPNRGTICVVRLPLKDL